MISFAFVLVLASLVKTILSKQTTIAVPCQGLGRQRRGLEVLLVTSCYRKRDKVRPDGPFSLYGEYVVAMDD